MLWLTIGAALLLAALAITYVVWPLWQGDTTLHLADDSVLAELLARKDAVLLSIKELEFDYQTGKLSSEDFERLNSRLRQQAIGLLRQIETSAPDSAALEAELEAAILHQRQTAKQPMATVRTGTAVGDRRFCPQCGNAVTAAAKFCANCGTSLRAMAQTSALDPVQG